MSTVYTVNGKVLKNSSNDKWLIKKVDPFNPLGLPPNTVRVRTSDGKVPNKSGSTSYETATLVSGTTDVYDVYKSGTSFYRLLRYATNVIEVLGANTTGVTNMEALFDGCSSLTNVPLFDTSNVTNMNYAFSNCYKVQSGALALYQQMSSQTTPPSSHMNTFYQCGRDTTTGSAELAQIPYSWGGGV